mmetsp:Transcript_305/g.741  ORF Transcript_305/g.741 Transcript_305/m.741 type:complete len:220 (+) Transcript_305:134-793(+)
MTTSGSRTFVSSSSSRYFRDDGSLSDNGRDRRHSIILSSRNILNTVENSAIAIEAFLVVFRFPHPYPVHTVEHIRNTAKIGKMHEGRREPTLFVPFSVESFSHALLNLDLTLFWISSTKRISRCSMESSPISVTGNPAFTIDKARHKPKSTCNSSSMKLVSKSVSVSERVFLSKNSEAARTEFKRLLVRLSKTSLVFTTLPFLGPFIALVHKEARISTP